MAKITFPDSFLAYTDSVREYETHTTVYRDLELELKKKYPGIENELDKSSLALDGQIYQDPFLEEYKTTVGFPANPFERLSLSIEPFQWSRRALTLGSNYKRHSFFCISALLLCFSNNKALFRHSFIFAVHFKTERYARGVLQ